MKNLSLAVKIGVLIGVLVLTSGIIAVVGINELAAVSTQMQNLVDVTGRTVGLAYQARVALLAAVRQEKNAVLTSDDKEAPAFAAEAREHAAQVNKLRPELARLVSNDPGSVERRQLDEFTRAWEKLQDTQKEVLRLAVLQTNVKGAELLHGDFRTQLGSLREFLDGVAERAEKEAAATDNGKENIRSARAYEKARRALGLRAQLYELSTLLHDHLEITDDREMQRLDEAIKPLLKEVEAGLKQLAPSLDDVEKAELGPALTSLDAVRKLTAKVQDLSHQNTDTIATRLSLTKTVEYANQCDAALEALIGALMARMETEKEAARQRYALARWEIFSTGLAGIAVSVILALFITRSITGPVRDGLEVVEAMARGDLSQRLNLGRRDEIGRFAAAVDRTAESLVRVVTDIRKASTGISASAGELATVSHELLAQSEQMATQAGTVASGTEQMSANVTSMAAAAEEMSMNVASISSASEEISATVGAISASAEGAAHSVNDVAKAVHAISGSLQEVARDARSGSELSSQARTLATQATATMGLLDQAAREITKVTEIIQMIAMQTNLLALNATIEATSAGEAGKGFAVVASEIKELASQSGQSARDIALKIEGVQLNAREAVKAIQSVAQVITDVNESANRITEAVECQTRTADRIAAEVEQARKGVDHIARSIADVAKGAEDMSRNAAEAATASTDVSRNAAEGARAVGSIAANIHGVSGATRENSQSAGRVNGAARRLTEIAGELQRHVGQFTIAG